MNKVLQIYQFMDSYCYSSDSLFLWDFARDFLKYEMRVLDVCSGSGIVGLLCGRDTKLNLTQVEIQPEFCFINIRNAQANGISSHVVNADFRDFRSSSGFDLIVSNPPFYSDDHLMSASESKRVAKSAKFLPLPQLVSRVSSLLNPGARFVFCYHAIAISDIILSLHDNGLSVERLCFVFPRICKNAKLVLISARCRSNSAPVVLSPIITHLGDGQSDYSDKASRIYAESNVHSVKVHTNDLAVCLDDI